MKSRCYNKNNVSYPRYGAKGVTVSEEWHSFENFVRDMGKSYFPGATIDRIDNNKGYSKGNCRWATRKEQLRNKRSVERYSFCGEKLTIPELAEIAGVKPRTMYARLKRYGWSVGEAVGTKADLGNRYKRKKHD